MGKTHAVLKIKAGLEFYNLHYLPKMYAKVAYESSDIGRRVRHQNQRGIAFKA